MEGVYLNQSYAEQTRNLIEENFNGIEAEWWWERRLGGGVTICQQFEPEVMVKEIAAALKRGEPEVREVAIRELGLEDFEPVVLTYDLEGDIRVDDAARLLQEKSSTTEGLAEGIYRYVAAAVKRNA